MSFAFLPLSRRFFAELGRSAVPVSRPDEAFEREASSVADRVHAGEKLAPAWSFSRVSVGPPFARDKIGADLGKRTTPWTEPQLERRPSEARAPAGLGQAPAIVRDVTQSPGRALDCPTSAEFGVRFGHDFGGVRVHSDKKAAASAQLLGARAYTSGDHIVFGDGQFSPTAPEGRKLLAHELAHVVQGRAGTAALDPGGWRPGHANTGVLARSFGPQSPTSGLPGPANGPKVTPEIERQLIEELQRARIAAPPASTIAREARRTFAVAAIISPDGKVTFESAYFDSGMAEHAEPQLLKKLEGKLNHGDTVAIAVDQVVCGPDKANCEGALKAFRENPNNGSLRVFNVRALRRDVAPGTTPLNASPEQLVSPKTAITRDISERFNLEEVEFRRIRLPIYQGPKGPSQAGPEAPGAIGGEPPAAAPRVSPPAPAEPGAVAGPGGGGRLGSFGITAAKFLGPLALDVLNRYLMGKEETKRAIGKIDSILNSPATQGEVADLVERERLSIVAKQLRGGRVFVTVSLHAWFTNDVLDKMEVSRKTIDDSDRSDFKSVVMSHDLVIGAEHKEWFIDVSIPLPQAQTTEPEAIKLRLDLLREKIAANKDPAAAKALADEKDKLATDLKVAEKKEAAQKAAEIRRAAVEPDPKKRAAQQADIIGKLRDLGKDAQGEAGAQPAPAPRAPPQSLVPAPDAPVPNFLPGAQQGPDPAKVAARTAQQAVAWATRLETSGTALEQRLGSNAPPSEAERRAYIKEEQIWALAVKGFMNQFHDSGLGEAQNTLGELLDRKGPRLHEISIHLGGE